MSEASVQKNLEFQKLAELFGSDIKKDFEIEDLPYSQVLILMDPDIDGSHSSALALSFIAKYFQPIVANGFLSIIKPPKFRVRFNDDEMFYAWTETELGERMDTEEKRLNAETTRFKGVAQFSIEECNQLFLDPSTRKQYTLTL